MNKKKKKPLLRGFLYEYGLASALFQNGQHFVTNDVRMFVWSVESAQVLIEFVVVLPFDERVNFVGLCTVFI